MTLSQLARSIAESPTLRLNEEARYLKEKGEPVIHLGIGEPKNKTPISAILSSAAQLNAGDVKYTPTDGIPSLKKAIIRYTEENYDRLVEPENVIVSSGAKQALFNLLFTLINPQDEVVILAPYWVSYPEMVKMVYGVPVIVTPEDGTFHPRMEDIERKVTSYTKAIIVNSPNNPSGRIYREPELAALGRVLEAASERNGRTIALLSDESYNRIVFDGIEFRSPALDYAATITIYTYGKTLLAPGQRIGYAAMSPTFPERRAMAFRIMVQQLAAGWGFPNALLQHAISDLEALSIDIAALQARRDRMVPALQEMGYEVTRPEGTFYLMVRSPDADDRAFTARLAALGTLVLPGTIVECPGWFRVSLTASDVMVDRGLEAFRAVAG